MLGNVICVLDEGLWDENVPKSKNDSFLFYSAYLSVGGQTRGP